MALVNNTGLGVMQPYVYVPVVTHQPHVTTYVTPQQLASAYALAGQDLNVNWASGPGVIPKADLSSELMPDNFHIYVGDLSFDIEAEQLREAFQDFGKIADAKIIRDSQTMKSKGFGFVSFFRKQDADQAISAMNGQWLGSRAIKTGWAARRAVGSKVLTFEDVASQSSPSNTTVYCGGVAQGCTNELMRQHFAEFGNIVDIRCFADKGYAFVRFQNKEQAVNAILHRHGTDINGYTVKCSWGKEAEGALPVAPPHHEASPTGSTGSTTPVQVLSMQGHSGSLAAGGYRAYNPTQYNGLNTGLGPGGLGTFPHHPTWTNPHYPGFAGYQGAGLVTNAPTAWGLSQFAGYQQPQQAFQPNSY